MAIIRAELENVYKSAVVSDAGTNGGRMSASVSVDGASDNLFSGVSSTERAAGSTKYRKAFFKNSNVDDLTLFESRIFVETNSPGDDDFVFFAGTQDDVQSGITGSERLYGAGILNATVIAGATSIDVLVEDGAQTIFANGDLIRISDKTSIDDLANNEEFNTINGVPSVVGDVITIPLTTPLANGYALTATKVASIYEPGEVKGTYTSFVVTSAGTGAYDDVAQPLLIDNIGSVFDDWTLTFTDATNFSIVGANEGAQGSGNTGSDTAPVNASFSEPYFTIFAAGFSGTFQAGDTITFTTSPAAVPVWIRRIVPAGANALAGNSLIMAFRGESG